MLYFCYNPPQNPKRSYHLYLQFTDGETQLTEPTGGPAKVPPLNLPVGVALSAPWPPHCKVLAPLSRRGWFEHSRFRRGQEERRLRSLRPWLCHVDSTPLTSSMMVCKQLGLPSCKWVCCFPPPSRRGTSVKHLLWGKVCDNPAGCTCVPGIALRTAVRASVVLFLAWGGTVL